MYMSALTRARKITGKPNLTTHADIREAIAELEAENERPGVGPSDGRVTQIIYLQEAAQELTAAQERLQEQQRREALGETIRRERATLESLERQYAGDRWGDRMLEKTLVWFDAEGHRHTRRYTTERGFLRAYIRLLEADADIWRAD